MKKFITLLCVFLIYNICQVYAVTIVDESVNGVDRYAIYIGANDGGKGRERLLYAGSDALSFKNAMSEIGGVTDENSRILIDPTKDNIDSALKEITDAINSKSGQTKRSEFIFYYSGHSDENALLLGNSKYDYSKLKAAITEVPSDIHVVILDSCYSGNFIRTKGGQKRKPFLIDDSSVVTGHAYLSSSSDNESSQESDEIESSYFTNAMITGLRGAADTSGDNKVTLNELYSYAFSDTLSKTEASKAGPQHPNYNITLVGSGDLILSDLTIADSMLSLSKDAKGRFIIRDSNDKLISEINKTAGQPIFMALPVGQYSALIIDEYSTKQGTFILEKDQVYVLDQNSLGSIKRKSNRLRGDSTEESEALAETENSEEVIEEVPEKATEALPDLEEETLDIDDLTKKNKKAHKFSIIIERTETSSSDKENSKDKESEEEEEDFYFDIDVDFSKFFGINVFFVPGLPIVNTNSDTVNFSFGIVGSLSNNVYGINASDVFNISKGSIFGGQYAGVFNLSSGNICGAQAAGVFDITKNLKGAQLSGVFNIAHNIEGAQAAGVFNFARNVSGFQASGVANIGKDLNGAQVSGVTNIARKVKGLQISGVLNVASVVDGIQIGLINIAKENNGITIGLLNFIGNGLSDINTSINTNGMLDFYLQSGSRKLYTIFGYAREFDNEDGEIAGVSYIGLGSQIPAGIFSFEIESLFKLAWFDYEYYPEFEAKMDTLSTYRKFEENFYPSVRVNWNVLNSSFASLFVSTCFDFFKPGSNDIAYNLFTTNLKLENDDIILSTSFSVGGKFHF